MAIHIVMRIVGTDIIIVELARDFHLSNSACQVCSSIAIV